MVVLTLQGQDPLNLGMRNIVLSSLLAQRLRMREEMETMVMTERKERTSKWQIIVLNSMPVIVTVLSTTDMTTNLQLTTLVWLQV